MSESRRTDHLDRLAGLDPEGDAQRIVHRLACYEFPWDLTRSLEIALFRTFCVPAISGLLDRTGEFRNRAQQRYDDTDILISELMESGYDSDRGRRALHRINQQHARFQIANEEFLYVLSTFIYEPIRWNARFGWRLLSRRECSALFHFWRSVGLRMGIRHIPHDDTEFEEFNLRYESTHFRYADCNHRIGCSVLEMFCGWFPRPLRRAVRHSILSLLDDSVIEAFGFLPPPRWFRMLVYRMLRLRAAMIRILPKRRRPRLRTRRKHPTYPDGYRIEQLGPPGT